MATREVTGGSRLDGLTTMVKAALPAVPGLNLLPGVAKRGGALPDLTLTRQDVALDPEHIAAYARVCEFPARPHLPLTYPHMLSFPLQMGVMTDQTFPFPAIGTVHLANTITQHRAIAPTERLGVTVHAANLRPHPKGQVFDLLTEVTAAHGSASETVWESTSEYLRVGKGDKSAAQSGGAGEALSVVKPGPAVWRLPADLGRRYAAVSGDYNPIHLYPLTAKALGFDRQIAHGMWTLARCVAAVENRLPDAVTVRAEFKKPVFLPGSVGFGADSGSGSNSGSGAVEFSMIRPKDGAPHVVGRAVPG